MANLVIRAFEPRDDEGFRHVRAMAYRHGDPVSKEDKLLRSDCLAYVGELDGEIVAATTVIDMACTKGDKALRCGGLAAVGVIPERRRGGVGSALMTEVIKLLHEEGFAILSLYPFRATYYRKFGYEFCGHRIQITCPVHRLSKIKPAFDPVLLPYKDRAKIYPVYEQYAKRYAGMNLRNEDQWWRVLGADTPMQVYTLGDPIEGYILLKLNSDFWNTQNVKEVVWNTGRAYDSILAFFSCLGMNKNDVVWPEPSDGPFFGTYMDQGITGAWNNDLMFRVLDIPACLSAIKSEEKGEFSFHCEDHSYPANTGSWHVCFSPEGTRVERGGSADFSLSIGTLTQSVLGDPDFGSLLKAGRIEALENKGTEVARRFFGRQTVYCTDFF
ncbi:MAG TPA: GNAT family N-acetyltransferase [Fimbriimonadaceae bacterium]|jgi:predicted acetyltransferase